jgi:hypothetical protein
MGIFRMYTGVDGKSVIEELSQDDSILETLKRRGARPHSNVR